MTILHGDNKVGELKKIERKSPTLGELPPAGALVTSKTDPLWKSWLEAEKAARAAGVEIPSEDMHLGAITAEALEASTRMVLDMVAEAKEPCQAEFAS